MTENDFLEQAEAVFERIQSTIDGGDSDIECNLNEAVLELELDDGGKIIINRHAPNQELWIAAKTGGFHFGWRDGAWRNTRDGSEFFASLSDLIQLLAGETLRF